MVYSSIYSLLFCVILLIACKWALSRYVILIDCGPAPYTLLSHCMLYCNAVTVALPLTPVRAGLLRSVPGTVWGSPNGATHPPEAVHPVTV